MKDSALLSTLQDQETVFCCEVKISDHWFNFFNYEITEKVLPFSLQENERAFVVNFLWYCTSWKAAKKEKAQKAPTAADDEDLDAVLMEFSTQASFAEK